MNASVTKNGSFSQSVFKKEAKASYEILQKKKGTIHVDAKHI